MNKENMSFYLLLGTVLAGIVCGVSSYLLPHIPLVWQISGALTVIFAASTCWTEKTFLKEVLSRRTTLYGLNSMVMALVFLAIVVVINMIVYKYDVKKDFTKNRLHTLSEQSVKVVEGLDREVKMMVFISPMQKSSFESIFDKYTYLSDKLKPVYVDVDQDPTLVQKYDVRRTGTIVIESEARSAKVDNLSGPEDPKLEEKITNALIQVAKGTKKKAYFITGHGEQMATDTEQTGLSQAKEAMAASRYNVEEISLVDKESVPEDAEMLVIAAPKSDFLPHEVTMLDAYLKKGGKVFILLEPDSSPGLAPFLAKYGVDWTPSKTILEFNVLQTLSQSNPLTPVITQYDRSHEITRDVRQLSIFSVTTPVEKAKETPAGYTVTSLFQTSPKSFVLDMKRIQKLKGQQLDPRKESERTGPVSLAVAVSGKVEGAKPEGDKKDDAPKGEKEFRLVVVGDADFANNFMRTKGVNSDLFQNSLSWLSEEEDLIAIRPKSTDESKLEITEARFRIINLLSVIVAPFAMFLSGLGVWLQRRRA